MAGLGREVRRLGMIERIERERVQERGRGAVDEAVEQHGNAASARREQGAGHRGELAAADPAQHQIRTVLGRESGEPYRSLKAMADDRPGDAPAVAFAMNGGMFDEDGYPVAEVWDAAGDRVHSVGRGGDWTRAGAAPAAAATSESAPHFGFAEDREPDADAPEADAAAVDDGMASSSDASPGWPTHEQPSPELASATTGAQSPDADGPAPDPGPPSIIDTR